MGRDYNRTEGRGNWGETKKEAKKMRRDFIGRKGCSVVLL